jgi:hypothetical protein
MSAERPSDSSLPPVPPRDDSTPESLTDYIDRMDREAFHRALEQRHLRLLSYTFKRRLTESL